MVIFGARPVRWPCGAWGGQENQPFPTAGSIPIRELRGDTSAKNKKVGRQAATFHNSHPATAERRNHSNCTRERPVSPQNRSPPPHPNPPVRAALSRAREQAVCSNRLICSQQPFPSRSWLRRSRLRRQNRFFLQVDRLPPGGQAATFHHSHPATAERRNHSNCARKGPNRCKNCISPVPQSTPRAARASFPCLPQSSPKTQAAGVLFHAPLSPKAMVPSHETHEALR